MQSGARGSVWQTAWFSILFCDCSKQNKCGKYAKKSSCRRVPYKLCTRGFFFSLAIKATGSLCVSSLSVLREVPLLVQSEKRGAPSSSSLWRALPSLRLMPKAGPGEAQETGNASRIVCVLYSHRRENIPAFQQRRMLVYVEVYCYTHLHCTSVCIYCVSGSLPSRPITKDWRRYLGSRQNTEE